MSIPPPHPFILSSSHTLAGVRLRRSSVIRRLAVTVAALGFLPWMTVALAQSDGGVAEPPLTIRITWGGGKPRNWSGAIRLVRTDASAVAPGLDWRLLSTASDAATTMHVESDTILVHEPRPFDFNGVELSIDDWRTARLSIQLATDGREETAARVDVPVADLIAAPLQQSLDREGNRLGIRRAAGDALHVVFDSASTPGPAPAAAAAGESETAAGTTVRRPGDLLRFTVHPLLPPRSSAPGAMELKLRVKAVPGGDEIHSQSALLHEVADDPGDRSPTAGRPRRFMPVPLELALPARESVYDLELEVLDRSGLRWTRPVASRTVQVVAVSDAPVAPPAAIGWNVIYELDPGSPRLHERLRRLPGVAGAGLSMPSVGLPTMPSVSFPSVPMPSMPLPSVPLPAVPRLPGVSLPSVSSIVPRLSGLLGSGYSVVEVHSLGPMLRLPPARAADEPAWEGMVIAAVQPGMPHLVEIEYPLDQDAVIGVSVLEHNAAGAVVQSRHSGGFEVTKPAVDSDRPGGCGRHRFVFWPSTDHPLLLLSNPSVRGGALFGKVRVSAGPVRLPVVEEAVAGPPGFAEAAAKRRVHAFLPTPDFSDFSAADRIDAPTGRAVADWQSVLSGIQRSAEWLGSQGIAGAMVGVYGEGAAIWPSRSTLGSARWDSGAAAESGLDPVRKDMLEVLCRVYAREGLRLVPAVAFDGAVPRLESLLARGSQNEAGILCVGRDGKAPAGDVGAARRHYNILDLRVQQAVEELVRELCGRLRGAPAVAGVAIVLPHDGWLHLPGIAWGLDDATFARFLATVDVREPSSGDDRFARRAALVEGPLREQWLEWRAGVIADFHTRLADLVAEHDRRWSLQVVPTTLFSAGPLAGRFRPGLAGERADADVMREIGIDPGRIAAHAGVVIVLPHVHDASGDLLDHSRIARSNRAIPIAGRLSPSARCGAIAVEQPIDLDLKRMLPHGPFGNAAAAAPFRIHAVPTGAARARFLAESLVASDVEVVYDMGLAFAQAGPEATAALRALESLPAGTNEMVDQLPAPLVVRTRVGEAGTWVNVVNASGVPCRAVLAVQGRIASLVDVVDGTRLPLDPAGGVAITLPAWGVTTMVMDGDASVRAARVEFDGAVRTEVERRLADLHGRRAALERPVPLAVLDNPGFDLPQVGAGVTGWELVEPKRGRLEAASGAEPAVVFSSVNGLSTLRSNPFPAPVTGRVSIAVRLRLAAGDPQPPLRIALEAVQDDREYYRFAAVGGLTGGKPLGTDWSQFVLQVDDLPTKGLESLRVRLDLLGPGSVQIDDVRVFDLAFDEQQRVQLSKLLTLLDGRLAANDVGGCLIELDSYWPRFLAEFVSDEAVAAARPAGDVPTETAGGPGAAQPAVPERSGGMIDRLRRWWQ